MEKRGFWGFAFLLSLCTFFFCLDAKEKVPKRKNQGCVCPATQVSFPAKGQKLATLKQSALLDAVNKTFA
ncbi:hypothetical protein [Bacteroides faecis]|uniref:hypothetical protein n=1 Tax=Bacteroides faecis TaxID=674529 RepID=UPI002206B3A2|nr:hypothetical protein [Bacteroides faecis]MCS2478198.1 hypothetical protein [Bacteroides faecis]UVQ61746.1 hypothetical protein NXY18_10650 [Bacteroides faecis]